MRNASRTDVIDPLTQALKAKRNECVGNKHEYYRGLTRFNGDIMNRVIVRYACVWVLNEDRSMRREIGLAPLNCSIVKELHAKCKYERQYN